MADNLKNLKIAVPFVKILSFRKGYNCKSYNNII